MSYDVYWVKNRAEKIADFEHPTRRGTDASPMMLRKIVGPASRNQERVRGSLLVPQLRSFGACSGFLIDTCPLGTRR